MGAPLHAEKNTIDTTNEVVPYTAIVYRCINEGAVMQYYLAASWVLAEETEGTRKRRARKWERTAKVFDRFGYH
eukprot:scaffold9204_cov83-Skeletonema_marinoi.AAC.1